MVLLCGGIRKQARNLKGQQLDTYPADLLHCTIDNILARR